MKAPVRVAQIIGFCFGALFLVFLFRDVIRDTQLFTDPRFDGFWDDVEAYHFKPQARKPPAELARKYGNERVVRYFLSPARNYLPNERAVFIGVAAQLAEAQGKDVKDIKISSLPIACVGALLALYVPMVVAARQVQYVLSGVLCRTQAARAAREAYFDLVKRPRVWAIMIGLGLTLALCSVNALIRITPEMKQRGVTVFDLTGTLLLTAYLSGIWIQLLIYVIDIAFLTTGMNPHHAVWDDVIAVAVMIPVLSLVYQNSWLTIATNTVAALAAGLLVKWSVLRGQTAAQSQPVLSP